MKYTLLRKITGAFLLGTVFFSGIAAYAGSATVSGTAGANPTYIVVPEEYLGKEGQFVATVNSNNTNTRTCGQPYINGTWVYVKVTQKTYENIYIHIVLCIMVSVH